MNKKFDVIRFSNDVMSDICFTLLIDTIMAKYVMKITFNDLKNSRRNIENNISSSVPTKKCSILPHIAQCKPVRREMHRQRKDVHGSEQGPLDGKQEKNVFNIS